MKNFFQSQTTERLRFSTEGTAWLWQHKHPLLPQTARDSGREKLLHSSHESLAPSGKTSLVLSSQLGNKLCADQREKRWSTHQPLRLFSPVFCIRYLTQGWNTSFAGRLQHEGAHSPSFPKPFLPKVFLLCPSSSSWARDINELLQAQPLLHHPGTCAPQDTHASASLCARPRCAGDVAVNTTGSDTSPWSRPAQSKCFAWFTGSVPQD